MALLAQDPDVAQVGRVTTVFWPEHRVLAMGLAQLAERPGQWPGLVEVPDFPLRLIITPDRARFDSVTAGRVPGWGSGVAFPASNTIVLIAGADIRQVLRHELAHLTLRAAAGRLPRWFEEGYASRAAGEWTRLEGLRVNWALVRGRVPSLAGVNRRLRGGPAGARASYALATTAVLLLERLGGEAGLAPLLGAVGEHRDLDRGLRTAYGMSLDQFEGQWRADVRRRFGWLSILTSLSLFWAAVLIAAALLWRRRRHRNQVRRAALDHGWPGPDDDEISLLDQPPDRP